MQATSEHLEKGCWNSAKVESGNVSLHSEEKKKKPNHQTNHTTPTQHHQQSNLSYRDSF